MLPIHFAPLQGYTEDYYRRAHHALCPGVACYYTPFMRIEHGGVRSKDLRDAKPANNQGVPVVPQLIVRDAQELNELLSVVRPMAYTRIDINMGCPFTLQTRHGRGAGLLTKPDEVRAICAVLRASGDIRFSVKMRLGLESKEEWREILPILNDTPLSHITLHPRVASQGYKGETDLEAFAAFANACHHPLVYNGDITRLEQIQQLESDFPHLHGVMIGRGLLARPVLAEEYLGGGALPEREVILRVKALHGQLLDAYRRVIPGESQQLLKIRTFWDYLEPTIGRKPWKKIHKAGSMRNYLAAVEEL